MRVTLVFHTLAVLALGQAAESLDYYSFNSDSDFLQQALGQSLDRSSYGFEQGSSELQSNFVEPLRDAQEVLSPGLEDLQDASKQTIDYTQYVQIFMGTASGGNMFPGVARPFGMTKLGPDLYTGSDSYSGYQPTGNISGFTMMHESGTGGAPKYGVVSQMPVNGTVANPLLNLNQPRAAPDQGSVGYYTSSLASGIQVELAATEHAGIYRYTFPTSNSTPGSVVIDVSHVLLSYRGLGLSQMYSGGNVSYFPDGHYETTGIYNNGWNLAPNWNIYSCGQFNSSFTSRQIFNGTGTTLTNYGGLTSLNGTSRLGVVYTFPTSSRVVESRVGISWISTQKACSYINAEIPSSITFEQTVANTKAIWNNNVLSQITTPETNLTTLQMLYSSLYGMLLLPSNRTGENPLWTSTEPYYDDIFTLWDLHRCSTALMQVLQPVAYEEQIRSLIDIWRNVGFMPDARSSNFNGRTQGGSNCDNVLADAYVKGVRGAVDWLDGYAAMKSDAEVVPPNNHDPEAPDSSTAQGRGALPDWITYGWITPNFTRAVNRAVEYSVNDFALSQIALAYNLTSDYVKYVRRSHNWRNHWNPNATSLGFSGFVVPRMANGSFIPQDPLYCGGCYWGDAYYEALPWEYSFGMTHDVATLIQYCGGNAQFVERLEALFTPGLNPANSTGTSQFNYTIFNPDNEPDFTTAYLYNFAGRQDLSVLRSRNVAKTYYGPSPSGLPGNSDAGAMQTWLLWNMIGLYPMTTMTTFLIHSPWFPMVINLGGGKALNISVTGGNANSAFYVQSLYVNGNPWYQNWLTWNDVFANGGNMSFVLGASPSNWFTGPPPPSPGSVSV